MSKNKSTAGFFKDIYKVARRMEGLNSESIFLAIFNKKESKNYIVSLNTWVQMYEDGKDGEGDELANVGGSYANSTVNDKKGKGLPYDHVTLYDTGDFYKTYKVTASKNEILISANTIKVDDTGNSEDLKDRWGDDIIGLNSESLEALRLFAIPKIIELVKVKLT